MASTEEKLLTLLLSVEHLQHTAMEQQKAVADSLAVARETLRGYRDISDGVAKQVRDEVRNEVQKLDIYKRIAGIENQAECDDMKEELLDRFGVIPTEADNLLRIALIRVAAHKLDMIDVKGKNSQIVFTLKDDAQIQVQNIPMLLGRVEHLSFNPKMRCFAFHYQKCGMVEKDERQLLSYTEELLRTMQECLTVQPCHS